MLRKENQFKTRNGNIVEIHSYLKQLCIVTVLFTGFKKKQNTLIASKLFVASIVWNKIKTNNELGWL